MKYNLHLKEEHRGKQLIRYPEITGHKILGYSRSHYVLVGERSSMDLSATETDEFHKAVVFTQQEIDNLPHGFVKLFDLIELKEELYYIKMPRGGGVVLNEVSQDDKVRFSDREETTHCKTKFTLEYIGETYPEYKQFAVKVEDEE